MFKDHGKVTCLRNFKSRMTAPQAEVRLRGRGQSRVLEKVENIDALGNLQRILNFIPKAMESL